ncbi:regulator of chromosome condensation 1/beta-lactamase-inhibitor protein II [Immersiella caudata]|uniref:Regulator of chromosome condensation 1/beta-lactamase-inhibitor protein II n=1 Tax=Immersiella caudata TaxID=314043 RepID=A0AA39U373_9PEZI|nr:regulator of chromosome condensation 1/beta-lactamase-inhibitor protein II [Immersiella caudata]
MLSRLAARRTSPFQVAKTSQWVRYASSGKPRTRLPIIPLFAVAGASGAAVLAYPYVFNSKASVAETPEVVFEKPRKKTRSKEVLQDPLGSQHAQVKKSWEQPGVYAWGSNAGRVVAPDSDEPVIKTPRRIGYFDGQLLRDLKLDREFGAAVTEKGDLVQWGNAFAPNTAAPVVTLKGKGLVKIATSKDRVIALSSNGSVYSVPVSSADQATGEKATHSSWIPFWSGSASISYRPLTPQLGWGEKVVDIKSGLEHCLLLTSKGRVFSAASSTESFPSRGQLGIPGLTWQTRPKGPFDQPHEITSLSGHTIKEISTGDFHSLALDKEGRVFVFGDNSCGQLGSEMKVEAPYVDEPSRLRVDKLYTGTNLRPKVTSVAAGGLNSYFTVDATKFQDRNTTEVVPARELGRIAAETWACGEGIKGNLGNGKWTHISSGPTKIKALSDLNEFDEKTNSVIPIRLSGLSVGNSHACAILDNATNVSASGDSSSDTNYGADILWWGWNEYYQLGTSKRSNVNVPTYIAPLDGCELGESTRMQITPRKTVRLGEGGSGRKASVEQRVTCGRQVTGIFSSA